MHARTVACTIARKMTRTHARTCKELRIDVFSMVGVVARINIFVIIAHQPFPHVRCYGILVIMACERNGGAYVRRL